MTHSVAVRLTVNGRPAAATVPARLTAVDFLREHLGLTGTHVGCAHGVCGACTIRIDGKIARGCLRLAAQLDGAAVETIEGIADSGEIAALQEAFHRHNALQCGFCTPGMLLTAAALQREGGRIPRDEIRAHLSGNLCRCTGYQAIIDAVEEVLAAGEGSRR
jgi:carbon-monoxide dehydrogenase small subunit